MRDIPKRSPAGGRQHPARGHCQSKIEALGKLTAYTKQPDMAMFNDAVTDWYRDKFVREHLGGGNTA